MVWSSLDSVAGVCMLVCAFQCVGVCLRAYVFCNIDSSGEAHVFNKPSSDDDDGDDDDS